MIASTARQVPELRAKIVHWCTDSGQDGAANWLRCMLPPDPLADLLKLPADTAPARVGAALADRLRVHLRAAELFFVAADMTTLAHHASASLTDYRLRHEDLPAPVGMMLYAEPPVHLTTWYGGTIGPTPVSLVTWGPFPGGLGVIFWVPTDQAADWNPAPAPTPSRPLPDHVDPDFTPRHVNPVFGHRPQQIALLAFDEPIDAADPGDTPTTAVGEQDVAHHRVIASTWLLMGQTLVRTTDETADRPARRRIHRIDPTLEAGVRYVELRRTRPPDPDPGPTDPATATGRTYHHQWVVTGHWRNQYYASRGDHRPIWIAPHLAGPDGAPLLGGERVHVWRR